MLGNVYHSLGHCQRAIEFYEKHLPIAREIGDRHGEGNSLWNLSLALWKVGKKAEAIAKAEAGLRVLEDIEHPSVEMVREALKQWRQECGGERDG